MEKIDAEEIARVDAIHAELDRAVARGSLGLRIVVSDGCLEYTADEIRAWPEVKAKLLGELAFDASAVTTVWLAGFGDSHRGYPGRALACDTKQAHRNVDRGFCVYRENAAFKAAASPAERKEPARRFAEEGMRVRCIKGEYAGLIGTVTLVRVMKNNCRVEFDGWTGCGVTCSLELGECLEDPLDVQERGLGQLPVTPSPGTKVDPYELRRGATHPLLGRHDPYTGRFLDKELVAYALQKADDEAEGRRARLVAALAQELRRPAPVRFPVEARSERSLPRSNGERR